MAYGRDRDRHAIREGLGPANPREHGEAGREGWGSEAGYGDWSSGGGYGSGGLHETMRRGPHTGKGPKGYKRADERIREDVCDRLEQHPEIDATDVEVSVKDGVVTLSGLVDERRTKRLAEAVIDDLPGIKDVNNHLRIGQGRLDEVLSDFSASGTTAGRGTTGAGGSVRGGSTSRSRR